MSDPSVPEQSSFHALLAQAIEDRDLTLERLSHRLRAAGLPLSIATLSYWQTGRSLPTRTRSVQAVVELEKILRVPPGHLTQALPGDIATPWDPFTMMAEHEAVAAALGEVTVPHDSIAVHDQVTVSADGTQRLQITRHIFESFGDGMDRFQLAFRMLDPLDPLPWVEARAGTTVGRVVRMEDIGLLSAEMLLPRSLRQGEMAMAEYAVHFDTCQTNEPGTSRAFSSHVQYAVFDVVFEGEPPDRVEYYSIPNSTDDEWEETRIVEPMTPGNTLQRVLLDPAPGVHGLCWSYQ